MGDKDAAADPSPEAQPSQEASKGQENPLQKELEAKNKEIIDLKVSSTPILRPVKLCA